jgi:predicted RNase H-like HicB family nuclease
MNYRFSALITKEDQLYVARCPELGVTSQGTDVESARSNLREAIELYLETWSDTPIQDSAPQSFWTFVEVSR